MPLEHTEPYMRHTCPPLLAATVTSPQRGCSHPAAAALAKRALPPASPVAQYTTHSSPLLAVSARRRPALAWQRPPGAAAAPVGSHSTRRLPLPTHWCPNLPRLRRGGTTAAVHQGRARPLREPPPQAPTPTQAARAPRRGVRHLYCRGRPRFGHRRRRGSSRGSPAHPPTTRGGLGSRMHPNQHPTGAPPLLPHCPCTTSPTRSSGGMSHFRRRGLPSPSNVLRRLRRRPACRAAAGRRPARSGSDRAAAVTSVRTPLEEAAAEGRRRAGTDTARASIRGPREGRTARPRAATGRRHRPGPSHCGGGVPAAGRRCRLHGGTGTPRKVCSPRPCRWPRGASWPRPFYPSTLVERQHLASPPARRPVDVGRSLQGRQPQRLPPPPLLLSWPFRPAAAQRMLTAAPAPTAYER